MKTENHIFDEMKYIIRYPDGYDDKAKYPVIFFLHGAGSRGKDIQLLESNPYFRITEKLSAFPFITIAPLCNTNTWFDIFEKLQKLVLHCMKSEFVDIDRFYLMGASMGGYATWQLAMSMPECFSAIVPICGGGMYWNAGRLVNVPVWAFHGEKDTTVLVDESKKMVEAVNNTGGKAKLTIYPENGHDAWSDTYNNLSVYEWLLSNAKGQTKDYVDLLIDSKLFG